MAGNETRLFRGQEQHGVGKVLDLSRSIQYRHLRPGRDVFRDLLGRSRGTRQRRQEEAGRNAIDVDIAGSEFARERLRQLDHRRLRRRVRRAPPGRHAAHVRRRAGAKAGGNVDYLSGLLPHHVRCRSLSAVEDSLQVQIQDHVPHLVSDRREVLIARDSGVVDQDVDRSVSTHDVFHERLQIGLLRDIDAVRGGSASRLADLADHRIHPLRVDVGDDDHRSFGRKPMCDRPAQPRPRSGHDGYLVFQAHGCFLLAFQR